MTKQEIKEQILGCAAELGRVPSILEFTKTTRISRRQIRKDYGSYTRLLQECSLERENSSGHRVPLDKLFLDWVKVVRELGKAPSMSEYEAMSKYSLKPLVRCFGSWRQVAWGLSQYAEGCGLAEQWKAELALAAASGMDKEAPWAVRREAEPKKPRAPSRDQPMDRRCGGGRWPTRQRTRLASSSCLGRWRGSWVLWCIGCRRNFRIARRCGERATTNGRWRELSLSTRAGIF